MTTTWRDVKLSVLDQSTLSEGSTAAEAIANTVALAKEADRLGYHRIWLSEHHNMSILQGSVPEVLLASIGAQTQRIRIGSGGIMLPNHSAYHVAEAFRTLEALYPGRVDCGIGRASGGDTYSQSLLNPVPEGAMDFPDLVEQLERFFHDECKRAIAMPMTAGAPQMWLLSAGGHPDSGRLAAEKGMGLAIALFINPSASPEAAQRYRRDFQPSQEFPAPRVAIALNVICAPTIEKLAELKNISDVFRLMRDSGRYPTAVYSPESLRKIPIDEEAAAYLQRIANREVVGLPADVKSAIAERAQIYDADEVMLTSMTYRIQDKLDAYRLIAQTFALDSPRCSNV